MVKRWDRLLRILVIPGKKGLREVATRDSRQASIIGKYWNAVERAIGPENDDTELRNFRPKTVTDAAGSRVRLLTNLGTKIVQKKCNFSLSYLLSRTGIECCEHRRLY